MTMVRPTVRTECSVENRTQRHGVRNITSSDSQTCLISSELTPHWETVLRISYDFFIQILPGLQSEIHPHYTLLRTHERNK